MAGSYTGGFELSAIPQAPVFPTNLGHFDPSQVMQNFGMGADLYEKLRTQGLQQKADTAGLKLDAAKSQSGLAQLPSATTAAIAGNEASAGSSRVTTSQKAREEAFARAQDAKSLQDAANYARYTSGVYDHLARTGNPADFSPFSGGGIGGTPPAAQPSPQAPATAAPDQPAPPGPLSPAPAASDQSPTPSGVLSTADAGNPSPQPTAAAPSAQPNGPLASVPAPQFGGGGSGYPLFGGVLSLPNAGGGVDQHVLAPSPMLGRITMGVHAVPVGTDAKGIPLYQNIEETPLGAKPFGRPFAMTSQADGGVSGGQTGGGPQSPPALPAEDVAAIQKEYGNQETPQLMQARLLTPDHQKLIAEANDDAMTLRKQQQNMDILTKAVYANNGVMPDPSGKVDANGDPVLVPDPNAKAVGTGNRTNFLSGTGIGMDARNLLGDTTGNDLASARSALVGDVMSTVKNIRNLNEYKGVTAVLPDPTQPADTQIKNVRNAARKLNNLVAQNDVYKTALSSGLADGDAADYANKKTAGLWNRKGGSSAGGATNAQPAEGAPPKQQPIPKAVSDNPAYSSLIDAYQKGGTVTLKGQKVRITGFNADGSVNYEPSQ